MKETLRSLLMMKQLNYGESSEYLIIKFPISPLMIIDEALVLYDHVDHVPKSITGLEKGSILPKQITSKKMIANG